MTITASTATSTATSTAKERVARGYAWLRTHRPDQISHIDPHTLDITCIHNCVLGQTGGWESAKAQLFPKADIHSDAFDPGEYVKWHRFTVDHGFHHEGTVGPDALTAQWLDVLATHHSANQDNAVQDSGAGGGKATAGAR